MKITVPDVIAAVDRHGVPVNSAMLRRILDAPDTNAAVKQCAAVLCYLYGIGVLRRTTEDGRLGYAPPENITAAAAHAALKMRATVRREAKMAAKREAPMVGKVKRVAQPFLLGEIWK